MYLKGGKEVTFDLHSTLIQSFLLLYQIIYKGSTLARVQDCIGGSSKQ